MRNRVILSLIIAIAVIGGAGWKRFVEAKPAPLILAAVEDAGFAEDSNPAGVADSTTSSDLSAPVPATAENLTDTDLVSRQLFGNFFSLISAGQATPDNVDTLTQSYVDNMGSMNKASLLLVSDLNVVPDSKTSFQAYADKLLATLNKYEATMKARVASGADVASLGPDFLNAMSGLGDLYSSESEELTLTPVPKSIALDHLDLVNTYRSASEALDNLSNIDQDPVDAYSGLLITEQALAQEQTTVGNIVKTLSANGIISVNP